jgi:hypothetical protein
VTYLPIGQSLKSILEFLDRLAAITSSNPRARPLPKFLYLCLSRSFFLNRDYNIPKLVHTYSATRADGASRQSYERKAHER